MGLRVLERNLNFSERKLERCLWQRRSRFDALGRDRLTREEHAIADGRSVASGCVQPIGWIRRRERCRASRTRSRLPGRNCYCRRSSTDKNVVRKWCFAPMLPLLSRRFTRRWKTKGVKYAIRIPANESLERDIAQSPHAARRETEPQARSSATRQSRVAKNAATSTLRVASSPSECKPGCCANTWASGYPKS